MALTPFTLEEAQEIAEDFEDLVDTEFTLGADLFLVDAVVISPFTEQEKLSFTEHYHHSRDAQAAMAPYLGNEYDVLLITSDDTGEAGYGYLDIRSFVLEKGIRYNFPTP